MNIKFFIYATAILENNILISRPFVVHASSSDIAKNIINDYWNNHYFTQNGSTLTIQKYIISKDPATLLPMFNNHPTITELHDSPLSPHHFSKNTIYFRTFIQQTA
jgi:hypothetical protein